MSASKEEILHHIHFLSFPRRTGSSGEAKAFQYIHEHFKKYSLNSEIQSFSFSSSLLPILSTLIPLVIFAFLSSAAYLSSINPAITFLLIAVIIALFILTTRWNWISDRMAGWPGSRTSNNIIARIPNDRAKKEFVFIAHYDSKSQTLPLYLRVASMILFFLSSILSLIGTIGIACGIPFLNKAFLIYPLALCLISILLSLLNVKGNISPGAIDNATGVALLLELARVIQNNKSKGMAAYTFVATGAEEEGLIGAFHFIERYKEAFKKRETLFINYDGAGAPGKIVVLDRYGLPPLKTSTKLSKRVLSMARKEKIDITSGYLPPGVGVDTIPIAYQGFDAITFSSQTLSRALFCIHSSRDVPENINLESLEQLANLSLALSEC